jgi:hypothetical protein
MMMRSVLATIIYGIIPASGGLATRPPTEGEEPVPISLFWTAVTAFVYPTWLAFVLFLSVQWRDRLDGKFVAFSQYVEALLLGKKSFVPVSFLWRKDDQNGDLETAHKQDVK